MILYHFPHSPFARRARLAFAHKGLEVELRDARNDEAHKAAMRAKNPLRTVPVLVDGADVIVDSHAIARHLEAKVPSPSLWPGEAAGGEAAALVALVDGAITHLVDMGLRYAPVAEHAAWDGVQGELIGRAQGALDAIGERLAGVAPGAPIFGAWSWADMSVVTLATWLEGLPERAKHFPPAKRMTSLGWKVPAPLAAWAAGHAARADVAALQAPFDRP